MVPRGSPPRRSADPPAREARREGEEFGAAADQKPRVTFLVVHAILLAVKANAPRLMIVAVLDSFLAVGQSPRRLDPPPQDAPTLTQPRPGGGVPQRYHGTAAAARAAAGPRVD